MSRKQSSPRMLNRRAAMARVESADDPYDRAPQERERRGESTLSLIKDSKIDRDVCEAKAEGSRRKKYKLKWMSRPMVMPETILGFLEEDDRENSIRYLSNFLVERSEDLDNYNRAGYLVFNSCSTMCILIQEILDFYKKMKSENFDARSTKRLTNVLTLFQSVAANSETRQRFVDACVPNYLIPLIMCESTSEGFEDVRIVALSVIGILCQGREPRIVQWATKSGIIEVCCHIVDVGGELSKVIAMHILEAVLHDDSGLSYICSPKQRHVINELVDAWSKLVNLSANDQDSSPRLLFHTIRCYLVLCQNDRAYDIIKSSLPDAITSDFFHEILEEYPVIRQLLRQLLLSVGKEAEVSPSTLRD